MCQASFVKFPLVITKQLSDHSIIQEYEHRMDGLMNKTEDRKSRDTVSLDLDPDPTFISKVKIKTYFYMM
jgi:hypothetical protein